MYPKYMPMSSSVLHWSLDVKDIDKLLVAMILAESIKLFVISILTGVIAPVLRAFVVFDNPVVTFRGRPIVFDVEEILIGVIRLVFMVYISYLMVHYKIVV